MVLFSHSQTLAGIIITRGVIQKQIARPPPQNFSFFQVWGRPWESLYSNKLLLILVFTSHYVLKIYLGFCLFRCIPQYNIYDILVLCSQWWTTWLTPVSFYNEHCCEEHSCINPFMVPCFISSSSMAFPSGSVVKNLPANAEDTGSIPGLGRHPGEGNGNPLQYSCLGNPMDRRAWQGTICKSQKSRT